MASDTEDPASHAARIGVQHVRSLSLSSTHSVLGVMPHAKQYGESAPLQSELSTPRDLSRRRRGSSSGTATSPSISSSDPSTLLLVAGIGASATSCRAAATTWCVRLEPSNANETRHTPSFASKLSTLPTRPLSAGLRRKLRTATQAGSEIGHCCSGGAGAELQGLCWRRFAPWTVLPTRSWPCLSALMSNFTVSVSLFSRAKCIAVRPSSMQRAGLAPYSSSTLTQLCWRLAHAWMSGGKLTPMHSSGSSGSTVFNKHRTTLRTPYALMFASSSAYSSIASW
eukprot:4891264-Prymnesium_polylepis.1